MIVDYIAHSGFRDDRLCVIIRLQMTMAMRNVSHIEPCLTQKRALDSHLEYHVGHFFLVVVPCSRYRVHIPLWYKPQISGGGAGRVDANISLQHLIRCFFRKPQPL